MLKPAEVQRVVTAVITCFGEEPDIFASIKSGVVQYEIVIYAPQVSNVGRGASLFSALE